MLGRICFEESGLEELTAAETRDEEKASDELSSDVSLILNVGSAPDGAIAALMVAGLTTDSQR